MKHGKKYTDSCKLFDKSQLFDAPEALELAVKTKTAKFDETVEIHVRLGVDSRHADQQVRGAVVLPNGTGKKVRVCVFAKGDNVKLAEDAGADIVGAEELAAKIQNEGFMDFDVVIATPDMMGVVGRLGKVLGPRGLMPNPKGKVSFGKEKLQENFDTLMGAIVKARPAAAKGQYVKSCVIATTMGPGIRISPAKYN